jgi:hypothetical protein
MLAKYKELIGMAALVASFFFGAEYKDRAWAEKVANAESKQKSLVIELERSQKQSEYLLLESVNDILEQEDSKTEVIYREKIVYRNSPDAGTCKFPARGVQIINSAAGLPPVPAPASDAKAEAKTVSDIEVVDVVTENYQMCRRELTKYFGLWQWAESVYNLNK